VVSTIAAVFCTNTANKMVLGTDWRAWYVPANLTTLLLLVAIAVFAFWRSLGDRELIEGDAA
jgi:hypothetical protein